MYIGSNPLTSPSAGFSHGGAAGRFFTKRNRQVIETKGLQILSYAKAVRLLKRQILTVGKPSDP